MRPAALTILFGSSVAIGQISTDGSLGPTQTLSGTNVTIPQSLGQTRGANVFHSFNQFNVNTGQTVTFDGAQGVSRIFSRVTGETRSQINGTLGATPGTDLYLINRAGVVFGPNATLDVTGRFIATTADVTNFDDNTAFNATPQPQEVLTNANPVAFGFLSGNPGRITFDGAKLTVANAAFSAPAIELTGATINSAGTFLSVLGAENVTLPFFNGEPTFIDPTFAFSGGKLSMANESVIGMITAGFGLIDVRAADLSLLGGSQLLLISGAEIPGSGILVASDRIRMRDKAGISTLALGTAVGPAIIAGAITYDLDRSTITTASVNAAGGPINLVGRQLLMAHRSEIRTVNSVSGTSGDLLINVREVALRASSISTDTLEGAPGSAGLLQVRARQRINLRDDSAISSISLGAGRGGDIRLSAREAVQIRGGSRVQSDAGSLSELGAGAISITSPEIIIENSLISSFTFGAGNANTVSLITTDGGSVTISGRVPQATNEAVGGVSTFSLGESETGFGDAGAINIQTGSLLIRNNASVNSGTATDGNAGPINIVSRSLLLQGDGRSLTEEEGVSTIISSQTESELPGAGNAGLVTIVTGSFEMSDQALITSSTFGAGDASDVSIEADTITVRRSTGILSGSGLKLDDEVENAAGRAGSISLSATGEMRLSDEAVVSVSSGTADAGSITLSGGELRFDDAIVTAATGGDGGNIALVSGGMMTINESEIRAEAGGSGENAKISLLAGDTIAVGNSLINGVAGGIDVLVQIDADDVLLAGSTQILSDRVLIPFTQTDVTFLAQLAVPSLDQGTRLQATCDEQSAGASSSFIVEGRGGALDGPLLLQMR